MHKTNFKFAIVAIAILIIFAFSWFFYLNDFFFPQQVCNQNEICKYKDTQIFSNFDSLVWLRWNTFFNLGSGVISWWDYGKETSALTFLKPVIKNPSQSLLVSVGCLQENAPIKCNVADFQPFEPEDKVKDVANFFVTSDENQAVCIAKKYNAKYVFLPQQDLNKFYWFKYEATGSGETYIEYQITAGNLIEYLPGKIMSDNNGYFVYRNDINIKGPIKTIYFDNNTIKVNNPKNTSENLNAIISKDFKTVFITPDDLVENMMTKLLIFDGYGLNRFKEIYNSKNVTIYSIDFSGVAC